MKDSERVKSRLLRGFSLLVQMETLSFAENRREKFRKLLSEEIKWTENEKELKISDIKEAVTIVQTM